MLILLTLTSGHHCIGLLVIPQSIIQQLCSFMVLPPTQDTQKTNLQCNLLNGSERTSKFFAHGWEWERLIFVVWKDFYFLLFVCFLFFSWKYHVLVLSPLIRRRRSRIFWHLLYCDYIISFVFFVCLLHYFVNEIRHKFSRTIFMSSLQKS